MASTYLSVSTTSSGTRTKWTTSFWVKRCSTGAEHTIFGSYLDSNNKDKIAFDSSNRLQFASVQAGGYSNGGNLVTNRVFRDTNAWYHIVLRWDTNNSTADDRMKIWVNGVEETSFSSRTNPTSGRESLINYTTYTKVGNNGSSGNYLDGVLSHIHFCDGYAYQASDFGSTDSTTGEWKINTSPSVSYGTNGFWWLKDSIATTDHSPNSNPFTVSGGTLTKTEDCPSNVFCTLNFLDKRFDNTTLTNGNLTCTGGRQSTGFDMIRGTIGAISGKYYYEVKAVDNAEIDQIGIGIINSISPQNQGASGLHGNLQGYGVQMSNGYKVGVGQSGAAYMGGFSANDIVQVAIDLDNDKITFGRNGQWANGSGGADQTYANSTAAFTGLTDTRGYIPMFASRDSAANNSGTMQFNFGNGYFGTTAVSSAGTNASNNGIFEYDVPTGFTALSTKGLNE